MDKISIIVPIYNAEQYIDKCLETVVKQTYKNLQIILVNDGSKDNSKLICEKWIKKDSRIELINKKNGGLSDARNVGYEKAKGEYIYFLDSDDWLPLDSMEKFYNAMKKYNLDMACGISVAVYKNGKQEKRPKKLNKLQFIGSGKDAIIKFKQDYYPMVWLYFYKKEFIEKNNLKFSKGLYHEDCEYTAKAMYLAERVMFLNEITYYQYISDNSIIRSRNPKKSLDSIEIADKISKFNEEIVLEKDIKKQYDRYIAYLYCRSIHYLMSIDEDINIVLEGRKKIVLKKLSCRKKYLILVIMLKLNMEKLYARIYKSLGGKI